MQPWLQAAGTGLHRRLHTVQAPADAGARSCRLGAVSGPPPHPINMSGGWFILADLMIKPGSRVYNLNVLKIALSLFSF